MAAVSIRIGLRPIIQPMLSPGPLNSRASHGGTVPYQEWRQLGLVGPERSHTSRPTRCAFSMSHYANFTHGHVFGRRATKQRDLQFTSASSAGPPPSTQSLPWLPSLVETEPPL